MFRVLSELTRLSGVSALSSKPVEGVKFNASLPVVMQVKEQTKPEHYLLDIGRQKEVRTQSKIPLEVGSRYWTNLKEDPKTKSVVLSNILKLPVHLQAKNRAFLPKIPLQELSTLFESDTPKVTLKMQLLHQLSQANSKAQFVTIMQTIHALEMNLFTTLLSHRSKETLFEFRKRKKRPKRYQESKAYVAIDFYAAFENLGPIEGVIEQIEDRTRLNLYLFYENSLKLLEKELKSLDLETNLYQKEGKIYPLFELANSLLDLKG